MSTPYVPIVGGGFVQPANRSFIEVSLVNAVDNGVVTLQWPFEYQNVSNVVAAYIFVTSDNNNNVLVLPDEKLTSPGMSFVVYNASVGNTFAINDFGGGNIIPTGTMTVGKSINLCLNNNTTNVPGNWSTFPWGQGIAAVTSVGVASSSTGITVAGSPITGAGVITLGLGGNLLPLNTFNTNGYLIQSAPNTFIGGQITGAPNQINVSNPTGAANNVISISNTLQVNQISTTDISIGVDTNNTISTLNNNEDLILAPLGDLQLSPTGDNISNADLVISNTHDLVFNGPAAFTISFTAATPSASAEYLWPDDPPLAGQVLGSSNAISPYTLEWIGVNSFVGPSTDNAIARFNGVDGQLQNSIPTITDLGDIQDVRSLSTTNFEIDVVANTISTNVNNNLILSTSGNGNIILNGLTYPKSTVGAQPSWNTLAIGNSGTIITPVGYANKNLLVNGNFNVWQLLTSLTAASAYVTNSYIADGWKIIYEGAAATPPGNVSAISNTSGPRGLQVENYNLSNTYARFTVTVANRKFGFVQMLSNDISIGLVGSLLTAGTLAKMSNAATTIKVAIVAWSGAVNAPTVDTLVSSWNASLINPTLGANWAYIGTPASISSTTWLQGFVNNQVTVATNNNLGIFIWEDSRVANVADTFDITCSKMETGYSYTPMPLTNVLNDVNDCQKYIRKSYSYSVVPGTAATYAGCKTVAYGAATVIANQNAYDQVYFDTEMSSIRSVTLYSPVDGTTGHLSDLIAGANYANNNTVALVAAGSPAGSVYASNSKGFAVYNNSTAVINASSLSGYHYVVNGTFF